MMKGFRTIAVNLAVSLVAVVDALANNGALVKQVITDPKQAGLALGLLGIVNLVLRTITNTPVGKRDQ